jgi:hypothetical protein
MILFVTFHQDSMRKTISPLPTQKLIRQIVEIGCRYINGGVWLQVGDLAGAMFARTRDKRRTESDRLGRPQVRIVRGNHHDLFGSQSEQ